jgi:GxxExxY protein
MGTEVIYPELSYQLIGIAYKIYNKYGYGMSEKFYQNVFAVELEEVSIPFIKEFALSMKVGEKNKIIRWFADFFVNNQIIVDLKVRPRLGYTDIKQVAEYLKILQCKLAIVIYFTSYGIKYRRVLNSAV